MPVVLPLFLAPISHFLPAQGLSTPTAARDIRSLMASCLSVHPRSPTAYGAPSQASTIPCPTMLLSFSPVHVYTCALIVPLQYISWLLVISPYS